MFRVIGLLLLAAPGLLDPTAVVGNVLEHRMPIRQSTGVVAAQAKRKAPLPVRAVSWRGIRYEAVPWGSSLGIGQNGGYVRAVDERLNSELWLQKIYHVSYTPGRETDVEDVFIRQLSISGDKRFLEILDERGGSYRLDLLSRTVSQ
jgi:hypothetical protein